MVTPIPPINNNQGQVASGKWQVASANTVGGSQQSPGDNARLTSNALTPNAAQRPWLKWAIIAGLVAVGIVIWQLSLGRVTVAPQPQDATVYVNGKKLSGATIKKFPGTVTVKIEKDGYLTYEVQHLLKFHGTLELAPELKELPVAHEMTTGVTGPLAISAKVQGVHALSADKTRIVRAAFKGAGSASEAAEVTDGSVAAVTEKSPSFVVENLNLDPLPPIANLEYPADQRYALITTQSGEIGVLDFSRHAVTSQDYSVFGATDVKSIAVSSDGESVFYWQFVSDLGKNFLARDSIRHDSVDRFFDQTHIDQLGVTHLKFRWSSDGQYILAMGEKTFVIDILNRKANVFPGEAVFTDGWFLPDGKTVVGLTTDHNLKTVDVESRAVTDHQLLLNPQTVTITGQNGIFAMTTDGKLLQYDFDTKNKTEYLMDSGIAPEDIEALAVDADHGVMYFTVNGTLYTSSLVRGDYNE